jgi:hypothetical protein
MRDAGCGMRGWTFVLFFLTLNPVPSTCTCVLAGWAGDFNNYFWPVGGGGVSARCGLNGGWLIAPAVAER